MAKARTAPSGPRGRAVRLLVAVGLISVALAAIPAGRAEAAAPPPRGPRPTPQLLDQAVAEGAIDRATADLHLAEVFAGRGRSARVPARFQSDAPWDGTMPLLRLRQRVSARPSGPTRARTDTALAAAAAACSTSTASLPNEATSTHFSVAYGTIGGGLTVNSYLTSLEVSYTTQVTTFGWPAPPSRASPPTALGGRYPVRIDALQGGLYGFVSTQGTGAGFVGDNPATAWDDGDAYASCMVLNRDYSGFRTSPQRSLDATTAHELNHSIQFGQGAVEVADPDDSFFEGSASWMEDEVFDASDDSYGYLWPNFRESLGDYDGSPYPFWIILRALTERFGTGVAGGGEQVMQDFWESISLGTGKNVDAMAIALANRGVSLPDAYHDAAIGIGFMRTCGGGYSLPLCFEEAAGYLAEAGLPPVAGSIGTAGGSYTGTVDDDYALAWVTLPASGALSLQLANTSSGGQLRATAVCDTGSTLLRAPFPAVVGGGATTTLSGFGAAGCVRRLAVITNQQQSPGNPSTSASRSFTLTTAATGANRPPVAADDSYTTFEATPLTIAAPGVLANDTDPDTNPLAATLAAGPSGGTVSLGADGSFTFTPSPGFTGAAGFGYTVADGAGGADAATVAVTVRPRPTYVPLSPARVLDTRPGEVTVDGVGAGGGPIGPGLSRVVQVTGRGGVPVSGVGAVVVNVTAVGPSAEGFFTVFPTGEVRPVASNLNFVAGRTVANSVVAKVGAGGQVSIFNASGSTHAIVDVAGWLPAA